MAKAWSKEELEYLKECYQPRGLQECSEVLGRSPGAVKAKASQLKIRRQKEYSKEEVLTLLKDYYERTGNQITLKLLDEVEELPSFSTVARKCGGLSKALEELGLKQNPKNNYNKSNSITKESLIESLKNFYEKYSKVPSSLDCLNYEELYASGTYRNYFGSFSKALNEAGLTKEFKSKNDIISRIKLYHQVNGLLPRIHDFKSSEGLPCREYIKNYFPSVKEAAECAQVPFISYNISAAELELLDFIKSNYSGTIETNKRILEIPGKDSSHEVDILLPELNLAFEFNGLYYHSDSFKHKNYHKDKTNAAESLDLQLIHVNEDEWLVKQNIVKSRILYLLNSCKKIYARKCTLKNITSKEFNKFLTENHIQGSFNSSIRLGLFLKGELVSVMGFAKSRYTNTEWELTRFCNKLNNTVVGGAQKLFKYFIREYMPNSIVSYADRRWSTGNLYNVLGFNFSHDSQPNYRYFKSKFKTYSRVYFQKHKLPKLLENFDPELSETDNMKNNGYYKIFDSGNKVYLWNK